MVEGVRLGTVRRKDVGVPRTFWGKGYSPQREEK